MRETVCNEITPAVMPHLQRLQHHRANEILLTQRNKET